MKSVTFSARKIGFTLVELLVVIGIIATLIAILMPTLAKVRSVATTIKCASNMRQIGLGISAFADVNNGRVPGQCAKWAGSYFTLTYGWQDILNQLYFKQTSPSMIPQYQSQNLTAPLGCAEIRTITSASNRVYLLNINANGGPGVNVSTIAPHALIYGIFRDPSIFNSSFVRLDPSNVVVGTYEYWLGAKLSMFDNASEKLLVNEGERAVDILNPPSVSTATLGDAAAYPSWCAGQAFLSFRHSGFTTMNALFVDMHVEGIRADRGSRTIDSRFYGAALTRLCQVYQ